MVHAATDTYGLFLDHTHTGSCLASIQNVCLGTFQRLGVFTGRSSDTAHALHNVQHQPFGLQ